jgi:hypothetical protein
MLEHRRTEGLPVFASAVLGLVAGHGIAYMIAIPDAHRRAAVLQNTGHAYLPLLVEIGLILAVAGAANIVMRALGPRARIQDGSVAETAVALGALQVGAFVVLEVVERLVTHMPLHELLSDHLLAVGVLVQLGVAVVGALALRAMARTAARLASVLADPRTLRSPELICVPVPRTLGPRPMLIGAVGVRGPPLP